MVTTTDLSAVRQSVDKANGLPNAHYIDPDIFQEERDALLFSQWSGLAVAADVPDVGDAVPLDFLGMPMLWFGIATTKCVFIKTSAVTAA